MCAAAFPSLPHMFLFVLSKLTKENKVNFSYKVFEIWYF